MSKKTRRNNGEGTAPYETKDGRWRSEIVTGWVLRDGKQRPTRKVVYGSTKKECQANLRAALRSAEEGTLVAGKMPTVEEWMKHWLDNICTPKVRPSTLDAYRSTVKTWVIPILGLKKLDKVTAEDLDLVYGNMRRVGRADSMILKAHRIISRAFKVAVQRGRLGSNPCRLIDAPGSHREEIKALTADQARAILKAAQDVDDPLTVWEPGRGRPPVRLRNSARWTVALALGLRQGEALGLCWDMINFEEGTMRVSRGWLRPAGGNPAQLGLLKTKGSGRTILMPPSLVAELKKHRKEQVLVRMAEGPNWIGYVQDGKNHELVFSRRDGRPLSHTADTTQWKSLLAAAGVPPARLHDARHTAATLLLTQGVPARVVMEILGHTTVTLTLGTYSHVNPELAEGAASAMENALFSKLPPELPPASTIGER